MMTKKYNAFEAKVKVDGTPYIYFHGNRRPSAFPMNINPFIYYTVDLEKNCVVFEFQRKGYIRWYTLLVPLNGSVDGIKKEFVPMAKYLLGFLQSEKIV